MPALTNQEHDKYIRAYNEIVQAYTAGFVSKDRTYTLLMELNKEFKVCLKCGTNCGYYNEPIGCGQ